MGRGRPKKVENMSESVETTAEVIEETPSAIPEKQEKRETVLFTIQNETLKNVTISCLDGVEVEFDDEGITKIEEKRIADYLLSIPSYKQI